MLGHGRISFETPNVIDEGDSVPETPSRSLQKDFANRGSFSRTNISPPDESRVIYKPHLSRSIKINYQDDADDEPTDLLMPVELDPEYGDEYGGEEKKDESHPGSPTMEDTRLFAAAMLSESERRGGSARNLFPSKRRRNEAYLRESLGLDYDTPYEYNKWLGARKRQRRLAILTTLAIVVLFTIFGIFMALHQDEVDSVQERMTGTFDFLKANKIATKQNLEDPDTPQYKAAQWIATQDAEVLDIPETSSDPFRFIQRYVLAVIYFSLGGENWSAQLNFLNDDHECSWSDEIPDENKEVFAVGVACSKNLQVSSLLIPSNNLKGSIPDEIQHLNQLKFVSFKHNDLTGTLPSALQELSLLEYLDVKFNKLEGTIPDFLGELAFLQVLGLSKNSFVGNLPVSLGTLRLKTLAVDDNKLTGDLSVTRLMTSLQYLYAQNNSFTGDLFHGLLMAETPSLVEVDLSHNEFFATEIPTQVFALPSLRLLDASGNKISGSLPAAIPKNNQLEYLSFRQNMMVGEIPVTIANLNKLTHLDLETNSLTGALPVAMSTMTSLSYLYLGENRFSITSIPGELKEMVSLKELSLNALGFQGELPLWLAGLTHLELLDLRENELTGSLDNMDFSLLQDLNVLMLDDNKLSGTIPDSLGTLTSLEVVTLYHNNQLSGSADSICTNAKNLEFVATDCTSDVTCPCCNTCCDGANCYSSTTWDNLENTTWEHYYARAEYAFNPNILTGRQMPRGGSI